jgi:hypothetical protein
MKWLKLKIMYKRAILINRFVKKLFSRRLTKDISYLDRVKKTYLRFTATFLKKIAVQMDF